MPPRDDAPDRHLLDFQEALKGRYSIHRELGRGGMGIVYLAQEVVLDRPVALKVLAPELARQPSFRERFLREARTAARLSHPHIVPIHAVDNVGGFVFFAMAYVDGETLGERIRGRGPLPAAEAARVLKQVAWALGYAHAQGVVHRDMKPDNILLEARTGRALVTDFGIAGAAGVDETVAGASEVAGTAEFMSPEQASGEAADGRSDLYSLGVVGHYALSGRLPFQGETPAATLALHLTREAPPIRSVAPETPTSLAKALDRCLAKNPNARFANGEELAAALGGVLERREVPAGIRSFIEETHSQASALIASAGIGTYGMAITVAGTISGGPPWWALAGAAAASLGLTGAPAAILVHKIRHLFRSGNDHDELLRVLADEVAERKRALDATRPVGGSRLDRWLRGLSWGGNAAFASGLLWLGWGPYVVSPVFWDVFTSGMVLSSTAGFGAALVSVVRGRRPSGVRGERWLRFWHSRLGRGLFKVGGVGIDAPALDAGYRPTEVAIGMAADRLFKELPTRLRREFADLPDVVAALEADADAARAQIEILAEVEGSGAGAASGRVDAVRGDGDVRASRAAAEARLAQVVAALESVRLQLIRMHAGIGGPAQLTQHLGDARALAADIERVVAGAREVDDILGIRRLLAEADTPTPV